MISYPKIDPVIMSFGPIQVRWYGLAYIVGVLLALRYLIPVFKKQFSFNEDQRSTVVVAVVLGIMLGGRLGYILFYDLSYYLSHPFQWLAIWNGGMSYHGGALGAVLAMVYVSKRYRVSLLSLLDVLGIGSTFGLFLGRIANFINGELYGRITTVSWGMVFPGGGGLPRHPSQLYEAFFEGVVIFVTLHFLRKTVALKPGQLFGVYLLEYGLFRFIIEFFREPDAHLGSVLGWLTMGQLLCVIMMVGSILFLASPFYSTERKR